ncbi:Hypothetical Protein RRSL_04683 [Ralstonia solanacearum UW551]|nr:Putative HTH-type transcriptional regulator YhjB [Ralstonia solanacearum]EAP74819.1 Hypothetical Protein RRSL_04683 [Ralstonia solanacearum UW551]ATI30108.1 helix-turn-helix transcriptional regulator [Ralstonia solanacearum]KEI30376.1 transcriptional regulator [Ralstonia solanacearum]KFX79657.1 transcriptional regulator [Ralstonia solanacearum]
MKHLGVVSQTDRPIPMAWPHHPMLTTRQQDILRETAYGKSNAEIAQALNISVETVKTHVRQILMRLEARNRTQLAAMYQQALHHQGRWQ